MKVLLVVVDAATPHVVCPAITTGRLPTLQRLAQAGAMHEASVTIFPSITPAATTSIITGCYPVGHGIAGASWYDEARDEVAYYGDDFWVIAREGFGHFLRDFLVRLNGDRLRAPTLFQLIEGRGMRAACLNYLVFKGNVQHEVTVPALMSLLPGVSSQEVVSGPSVLCLGDFIETCSHKGRKLRGRGGMFHRFGMDDASTGTLLAELMAEGLPDFTVAYFADNDFRSHEVGPAKALPVVDEVDRMLGVAFEAAGGLERVLSESRVIVTSDHGHCDVVDDAKRAAIQLDDLLGEFRLASLGKPWTPEDAMMICPNMRAAQIYLHGGATGLVERIASAVMEDVRIDQVVWRTPGRHPHRHEYVVSSRRGRLAFHRADSDSAAAARDPYGNAWVLEGDPSALELELQGGDIEFHDYPNALERIVGVLDLDQSGDLWVTAVPGCEFEVPGGSAHAGGASHGALHRLDSLSPLIVAGPDAPARLPRHMRSVDIAAMCREALGLQW